MILSMGCSPLPTLECTLYFVNAVGSVLQSYSAPKRHFLWNEGINQFINQLNQLIDVGCTLMLSRAIRCLLYDENTYQTGF